MSSFSFCKYKENVSGPSGDGKYIEGVLQMVSTKAMDELVDLGVAQKLNCSEEESEAFRKIKTEELPKDVHYDLPDVSDDSPLLSSRSFWRYGMDDVADGKTQTLLLAKLVSGLTDCSQNIATITGWVTFLGIITIVNLVCSIILLIF